MTITTLMEKAIHIPWQEQIEDSLMLKKNAHLQNIRVLAIHFDSRRYKIQSHGDSYVIVYRTYYILEDIGVHNIQSHTLKRMKYI